MGDFLQQAQETARELQHPPWGKLPLPPASLSAGNLPPNLPRLLSPPSLCSVPTSRPHAFWLPWVWPVEDRGGGQGPIPSQSCCAGCGPHQKVTAPDRQPASFRGPIMAPFKPRGGPGAQCDQSVPGLPAVSRHPAHTCVKPSDHPI